MYIGIEFKGTGEPLDENHLYATLDLLERNLAGTFGGYTRFRASGASVEAPEGEETRVYEILHDGREDRIEEYAEWVKRELEQGSVLVMHQSVTVKFI